MSILSIFAEAEFWVAFGFVCVLGIFLRLHVPRLVAGMLDKRANAIVKELDDAKRLREEAEALLASYKAKTAKVDAEACKILDDAKAAAERFAEEAREQLQQQIERRAKMAKDKIAMAEAMAVAEIRNIAADAAVAAAEKLIAARIGESKAAGLIEDSIKILPKNLN